MEPLTTFVALSIFSQADLEGSKPSKPSKPSMPSKLSKANIYPPFKQSWVCDPDRGPVRTHRTHSKSMQP